MKSFFFLIALTFSTLAMSQEKFHANISGRIRVPTFSPELQLEVSLKNRYSLGANAQHFYLDGDAGIITTFKGNRFELFGRKYAENKGKGNTSGWFGQAKVGYGNFENSAYDGGENYRNQRWNSFGGGIGGGQKHLIGKHFNLEFYGGLRFYSGPQYRRSGSFDTNENAQEMFREIAWYTWTAFPLEFNFRIGYQF